MNDDKVAKISSLLVENATKIKLFSAEFTDGLNVIGGANEQGKTALLNIITWLLKGGKAKPSTPKREGSVLDPYAELKFTNGYLVKLSGKNNAITVRDTAGRSGGVTMLKDFISEFSLDIPKFLSMSSTEKAKKILSEKGVDEELMELDKRETGYYDERTRIGRNADDKRKYAAGLSYDEDVGTDLKSIQEIINKKSEILSRNAQNEETRRNFKRVIEERNALEDRLNLKKDQLNELKKEIESIESEFSAIDKKLSASEKAANDCIDEDTAELELEIENVESFNSKVRSNLEFLKADSEANELKDKYTALSGKIEEIRSEKRAILDGLELNLPGLEIQDGDLLYNGFKWDGMSGAQQLKVAVAVAKTVSPNAGFVLLDKLEQMDLRTLKDFSEWVNSQGLQIIATRVSDGDECQIIIEDGGVLTTKLNPAESTKESAEIIATDETEDDDF